MSVRRKIALSVAAIALFIFLSIHPLTSSREDRSALGTKAWQHGDADVALQHFRGISRQAGGASPEKQFNLGTALAAAALRLPDSEERARQISASLASLGLASRDAGNRELRASALYNQGTIELLSENYDNSIALLRRALLALPEHEDARVNLEIALLARKNREEQSRSDNSSDGGDVQAKGNAANSNRTQELGSRTKKGQNSAAQGEVAPTASESGVNSDHATNNKGKGAGQSPPSRPRSVPSFGQSPVPSKPEELALQQKLDALERRSGQLRRAGLLRKSSERARKFRQGKE